MADLNSIQNQIIEMSNHYYNEGLGLALVRSYTLAKKALKTSLRLNKNNIDARNLLGLIYCTTGEYTLGMSEWIISSNIKPTDNVASSYLNEIGEDEEGLKIINNNIRIYNKAVEYANQKAYDLAIIQLRKIFATDKKFLRARVFMGVLLAKQGQISKAKLAFNEALKIDRDCEIALICLGDLGKAPDLNISEEYETSNDLIRYNIGTQSIIEPRKVKSFFTKGNIRIPLITAIITFLIIWFFIVPIKVRSVTSSNNETISALNARLDLLEDDKKVYDASIEQKEKDRKKLKKEQEKNLKLLQEYQQQIASGNYNSDKIIDKLDEMYREDLSDEGKAVYDDIIASLASSILSENAYNGYNAYTSGDYKKAIRCYEKVMQINEREYDGTCMYQLASAYAKSGKDEQALEYFTKVVQTFPGTDIAILAQDYIDKHPKQ